MARLRLKHGLWGSDLRMTGYPVVPEVVAPESSKARLLGELPPRRTPALRGLCRIITANMETGFPFLSSVASAQRLPESGSAPGSTCSELLSTQSNALQTPEHPPQRNRTHPALRLALLQMDLRSHEVNSLQLEIAHLNAAHPGFVLQDGRVIGTNHCGRDLRHVNEPNLLLWRQTAAGL